jgi:protease-4
MRRFLVGTLALIGALTLLTIGGGVGMALWMSPSKPTAGERIVLKLDLRSTPPERDSGGIVQALRGGEQATLAQTVQLLQQAAKDKRVVGVYALVGGDRPGFAAAQELRDALTAFRGSGKFSVAFAESFDEGAGVPGYYLASAFEQIWLQPSGDMAITGLMIEGMFFKGSLDKLGVTMEGGRRHEFKSATEALNNTAFGAPSRQNLRQLVDSLFAQFVEDASKARGIPVDDLRRLVDRAPLSSAEALQARLVDRLGYQDEVVDDIERRVGATRGEAIVEAEDYARLAGASARTKGPAIAVVTGVGAIVSGDDGGPLSDEVVMAAESTVQALFDAANDPDVKAIVFRIDSPGGSYVAADTIARAVTRARASGKPVVASMGDVAASGGYMAAIPADMIVAQPGTITGSIGVYTEKPVAAGLFDMLGVSVEEIGVGANVGMYSLARPMTPAQRANLDRSLDRIYADFTGRVMQARRMDAQQVDKVARGRVFTGRDAKAAGLVDELGGLSLAIAFAKAKAGIEAGSEVAIKAYPVKRDRFERLLELALGGASLRAQSDLAAVADAARRYRMLDRRLRELGVLGPVEPLRMPPLGSLAR